MAYKIQRILKYIFSKKKKMCILYAVKIGSSNHKKKKLLEKFSLNLNGCMCRIIPKFLSDLTAPISLYSMPQIIQEMLVLVLNLKDF